MTKLETQTAKPRSEKGIALVTALIITLVVFILVASTLYVITQSIGISGAGKRYATAAEAADGAVEVARDAIKYSLNPDPENTLSTLPLEGLPADFTDIVLGSKTPPIATVQVKLPGTGFLSAYRADVTVEFLYDKEIPGSTPGFPPRMIGGTTSRAYYYRISTVVEGPDNTRAETTALYRYVP